MLKSKNFIYLLFFILAAVSLYFFWNTEGEKIVINEETKKDFLEKIADKVKKENADETEIKTGEKAEFGENPISGLKCENYKRRPIAVIIAGDSIVRPLSGISEADLVLEMPVITSSITRMMAIFVCNSPKEIGSLRSARHNFISLAQGFDAIFSHWGGSYLALEKLNAGVMDNIDALPDHYSVYYRKSEIPPPYNGFTSLEKLIKAAEKYKYRLESKFLGYPHLSDDEELKIRLENNKVQFLEIGYPGAYRVKYEYNPKTGSYSRFRGGTKEIDKLNNISVEAKNVAIMRAKSYQIDGQYNNVEVEGENEAVVYRSGEEIKGKWKKDKNEPKSKLYFFDESGKEIKFAKGPIWIEVVQPEQIVSRK